jgi:hypothetical protein
MRDNFYFNELNNSYTGEIRILNQKIEFEIIQKESELNWVEIEQFIDGLVDDHFTKMIETSNKLLLEFIKLVPCGVTEPFNVYDFRLETIVYYGKVDNRFFRN